MVALITSPFSSCRTTWCITQVVHYPQSHSHTHTHDLVCLYVHFAGTRAIHTSQLDDAPWWVGDDWNPSIPLYDRLERNEDDPPIRDSVVQEGGNISTWSADGKAAAEIDQSVMDTHLNERGTNETEHGYLIFGSG